MSQTPDKTKFIIPGCYISSDERPDETLTYRSGSSFSSMARVAYPSDETKDWSLVGYESIYGIRLTAEWLENLGFTPYPDGTHALVETDSIESYIVVKATPISENEPPLYSLEFQDKDGRLFSVYASCVHELQITVWVLERTWLSIDEKEVSRV